MIRSQPQVLGVVAVGMLLGSCLGKPPLHDRLFGEADVVVDIQCSDGLVAWPQGVCAPQVDECAPWEIPIIGGGCLPVGPNGCPKSWAPEAEAECGPGEQTPCPEGHEVADTGGYCVPKVQPGASYGGNCPTISLCQTMLELGPPEQSLPVFDTCEPGSVSLPQGGCVKVGPRACPDLWGAAMRASDCQPGDTLPCPDSWALASGGLWCSPAVTADCQPGHRPAIGGDCSRVVSAAEDCPVWDYPEVPEGAAAVVYVDAGSGCTEGCGTEENPHPLLQTAVEEVEEGGYVLVAAGTYEGGLKIDRPVHVQGLCAAQTALQGSLEVPTSEGGQTTTAALVVVATHDVEIAGIAVSSEGTGVAVVDSNLVSLRDLSVQEFGGAGIFVSGGKGIAMANVWVHDANEGAGNSMDGVGLWVASAAEVGVEGTLVEGAMHAGIVVTGAKTLLDVTDSAIRDTGFRDELSNDGYGVWAASGAELKLQDSVVSRNHSAGLLVSDDAAALVERCVVRNTQPQKNAAHGEGAAVRDGGHLTVDNSFFEHNQAAGVSAYQADLDADSGTTTQLTMQRTVVRDTVPGLDGIGVGISVADGITANVQGCALTENTGGGILASGQGTAIAIEGTILRSFQPAEGGGTGFGIRAADGAYVTSSVSALESNSGFGVAAADQGTQVSLSSTVVRNSVPCTNGEGDSVGGVFADSGSEVVITGSLIEGNTKHGVLAAGLDTQARLEASAVRKTEVPPEGEGGYGIRAVDRAQVALEWCLVTDNRSCGICLSGNKTSATIANSVVGSTKPPEGEDRDWRCGIGIGLEQAAGATVSQSLIEENTSYGMLVADSGTHLVLDRSTVRGTDEGPKCRSEPEEPADAPFEPFDYPAPTHTDEYLKGISMGDGVVSDPFSGPESFGIGVLVTRGAALTASGCMVEENSVQGIGVTGDGSVALVSGCIVRNTQTDPDGSFGLGLAAGHGATVTVSKSRIERNRSWGLSAWSSGEGASLTSLSATDSLVVDTGKGGIWVGTTGSPNAQFGGDGVLAMDANVDLQSCILMDSSRAGAYYTGADAAGTISGSMIVGNRLWGLVLEGPEVEVSHEDSGNHIFGNSVDYPAHGEVTDNPNELAVPPAPLPSPVAPEW